MKLRCEIVGMKRQIRVPKGWTIYTTNIIEHVKKGPHYLVLFTMEEPSKTIGFHKKKCPKK